MKILRSWHCPAVWPPLWLITIFGFVYVAFIIGNHLIDPQNTSGEGAVGGRTIICVAAVIYAFWRLCVFHPAVNVPYASWLALSPWNPGKRLPLGPIHPVWQDAAFLASLGALTQWPLHSAPFVPAACFVGAYLFGLTLVLGSTKTWPNLLAASFLWPAFLLTHGSTPLVWVIIALLGLVICDGTRRSLRRFPWRQDIRTNPGLPKSRPSESLNQLDIRIDPANNIGRFLRLGWPFANLSPKPRFTEVSISTSFWLSALVGWWIYCIMVGTDTDEVVPLLLFISIGGALARLGIYAGSIAPPFTFRSRLRWGPLILPGFDKIFIGPLTAIAAGVVGGMVLNHVIRGRQALYGAFAGLIVFILLATGPTMRNWTLAGKLRLRPGALNSANRQTVRPV